MRLSSNETQDQQLRKLSELAPSHGYAVVAHQSSSCSGKLDLLHESCSALSCSWVSVHSAAPLCRQSSTSNERRISVARDSGNEERWKRVPIGNFSMPVRD